MVGGRRCVAHPHEPGEAKVLYRGSAVWEIYEAQKWKRRRYARMDPPDGTLGGPQELRQGTRLPGAQGQHI